MHLALLLHLPVAPTRALHEGYYQKLSWGVCMQVMRTPPTTYFIKKAMGLEGGSQRPGHQSAGAISLKQVYEIAKVKQKDRAHVPLPAICRSIMGTCRSMGIAVAGRPAEQAS